MHYLTEAPAAIEVMAQWVQEGRVKLLKTVYEVPLDEVPDVYRMMFEGHGVGKVVTKLK
jgi:NADPH-dependent curcumin reductase CurA